MYYLLWQNTWVKQFKVKRVILAHSLREHGLLWQVIAYKQEHVVTGHMESTIRKQEEMDASVQLAFPFLLSYWPQLIDGAAHI